MVEQKHNRRVVNYRTMVENDYIAFSFIQRNIWKCTFSSFDHFGHFSNSIKYIKSYYTMAEIHSLKIKK